MFPLTAPKQEPAVDRPASPPPPNPLAEPYPGVGKGVRIWVRILGSKFGFGKKPHPKIGPKNQTPIWKIRAKIRTENSATKLCTTKSASNLQPKSLVNLQDNTCRAPQRVSQRSRGCPLRSRCLLLPRASPPQNKIQAKNPLRDSGSFWNPTFQVTVRFTKITGRKFIV